MAFYPRQFEDILEFLPDATFAIDQEKKVILWNKAIERMTGVRKEDMIGRGDYEYSEIFYGRKRPMLIDLVEMADRDIELSYDRFERDEETIFAETFFESLNGKKNVYVWAKASLLHDQAGSIVGAIESIRDVTKWKLLKNQLQKAHDELERKVDERTRKIEKANEALRVEISERRQVEQELKKTQEMYRNIFEHAVEGIFQTTLDGKFIHANPAIAQIFGYGSPRELIDSVNNIGTQIYVDPQSRDAFMRLLNENYTTQLFTTECYRKDGSVIWVSISSRAVTDEEGRIQYYEGFLQDITKVKNAETALKESEERYRTAIESSNDGVAVVKHSKHVYVNQKFLEIFGYEDASEITGSPITDTLYQDDLAMVIEYARMRFKGKGGPSRYEFRGVRRDGSLIFVEVSIAAIMYDGGRAILCYLHDITEQKKMQEELLTKKKIESIGILAGGIAHDFNNMLAAIMGNISLAKIYTRDDARLLNFLEKAETGSIQASELTKRLITFSRGGVPMKKKADICALITKCVQSCLQGSRVKCEFSFERSLEIVLLDEGQVWQAINNIVLNSREAMADRGAMRICTESVTVGQDNTLSLSPGRYIKIAILDEGTGISKENIARIFDPYFTTKDTDSKRGMGLGLAVCYSIVKSHGGSITVESEFGLGTTMILYLPGSSDTL